MVIFVLMFVVFMLVTNVNFLYGILQHFTGGIESAWFIPILWPSLTIIGYLAQNFLDLINYALLSIALTTLLLFVSIKLRQKYWVPSPFSIKLSAPKPYTPKQGLLGSLGFSGAEAALIKKDLRGLTRRKEMIVWIAMPFGISIISFFSTQANFPTPQSTFDIMMTFFGPVIAVLMLAFYMSLTSIGQEGSAFLNLRIIPLNIKELIKAKLAPPTILSVCGMTLITILIPIFVPIRLEAIIAVTVTLFAVLFECAFVGLALGSRFPDFTEVPRARFVEQKGVWIGMAVMGACVIATIMPLALYSFILSGAFPILVAPAMSAVVCVVVCYASYQVTLGTLHKLTTQY
jgi:hypothetical protein